jgi:hypothetical protein
MRIPTVLASAFLCAIVGCGSVASEDGSDADRSADTGADSAPRDTAPTDSGARDSAESDSGTSDTATTDSAPSDTTPPPPTPGGDRDEHGCIGSAGYKWCAKEGKCVRPWDLAMEKGFPNTAEAFASYCGG